MPIKDKTQIWQICCWHDIHFDFHIYIEFHTPSLCGFMKRRGSAVGQKFILIFIFSFNFIDHLYTYTGKKRESACYSFWSSIWYSIKYAKFMPRHEKTWMYCMHDIQFGIQTTFYIIHYPNAHTWRNANLLLAWYSFRYSNRHSIAYTIVLHMHKNANLLLAWNSFRYSNRHSISLTIDRPIHKTRQMFCWHDIHFEIQIDIWLHTLSTCPYIEKKTQILCCIFISIFKSTFDFMRHSYPHSGKHTNLRLAWNSFRYSNLHSIAYTSHIPIHEKTGNLLLAWNSIRYSKLHSISYNIHMPIHKKIANLLLTWYSFRYSNLDSIS